MLVAYVLRRLAMMVPTLLGVVVMVFVILRIAPGDPISMMVAGEAKPEDIAQLRALYGLDQSIPVQFAIYLKSLFLGDFGTSISLKQNVLSLVFDRLPATIELALVATILSVFFGMAFGLIAVHWRQRWPEALVDGLGAIGLAIPEFLWALLLILGFGVLLPLFPIAGRIDPLAAGRFRTEFYLLESLLTGRWSLAGDLLRHIALPAIALALPFIAVISRVLKTSLLDAINQDYVLLARVKGFSPIHVLLHDVLPNALVSTITVIGVNLTLLIGGTVLVEMIFSYPGIGNMLFGAAINRDLPLLQGITVVFSCMFLLLNLIVDISYAALNPRVRHA